MVVKLVDYICSKLAGKYPEFRSTVHSNDPFHYTFPIRVDHFESESSRWINLNLRSRGDRHVIGNLKIEGPKSTFRFFSEQLLVIDTSGHVVDQRCEVISTGLSYLLVFPYEEQVSPLYISINGDNQQIKLVAEPLCDITLVSSLLTVHGLGETRVGVGRGIEYEQVCYPGGRTFRLLYSGTDTSKIVEIKAGTHYRQKIRITPGCSSTVTLGASLERRNNVSGRVHYKVGDMSSWIQLRLGMLETKVVELLGKPLSRESHSDYVMLKFPTGTVTLSKVSKFSHYWQHLGVDVLQSISEFRLTSADSNHLYEESEHVTVPTPSIERLRLGMEPQSVMKILGYPININVDIRGSYVSYEGKMPLPTPSQACWICGKNKLIFDKDYRLLKW